MQVQEAQRVPNKKNLKNPTLRHIIIKMAKVKDKRRILGAARERQWITYKEDPIRVSADFSTETFLSGRDWHEIFKVMKSKDLQSRLLNTAKLSFKIKEK